MSERPRHTPEELNEFAGAQPGGSLRAALANAMAGLKKHSQIVFDPVRTFEIFMLEPAPSEESARG